MAAIWNLEDAEMFNLLCPHKFAKYKDAHEFKDYKKGDHIYFMNDDADKVFLVAQGKVKIAYINQEGEEVVKNILLRGDLFGEGALLGEEKRNEFAQVLDNGTMICPMHKEQLLDLMREYKSFSIKIYKLVGFRMRKLERRIDQLLFKDAKTRLIEFIRELADEKGERFHDVISIKHFYSQKNIADLIGTSRQTLNALLNELKEANLIYFDRREILIKNIDVVMKSND